MFCEDLETTQALNALESLIASRRRPLVVWLGAGASAWAGYPLWDQLADQMHRRFAREVGNYAKESASSLLAEGAYPELFEEVRRSDSALYFSCLTDAFAARQPTPVYERMLHALDRIEPTYVLTTNVDESLERHLSGPEVVQRSDVERLPQLLGDGRAFICKLHGSISSVETMVFSTRDYDDVQTDAPFVNALRSVLADCSVLFLAYGLQDDHVIAALERGVETHPLFGTGPHFIVMPEGSSRMPANVRRISYRVDPADHRSALLTLETVADMQPSQGATATAAESGGIGQPDRDSVYFIGDLLPWGKHTTSQTFTAEGRSGRREFIVGEGYVDGEVVLVNYSALHDVVVGLICFDVTCLSINHLGRLHTLLGSFWFWRFVEVEAMRQIVPPEEPVVEFPEPGALVGRIETFKLGAKSSTEWGCEDCGKRRLEWAHRGPRKSVCKACQNRRYRRSGGDGLRERNRERMRQGRQRNRHRARGGAGADSRIPRGPGLRSPGPPLSDAHGMVSSRSPDPLRKPGGAGHSH